MFTPAGLPNWSALRETDKSDTYEIVVPTTHKLLEAISNLQQMFPGKKLLLVISEELELSAQKKVDVPNKNSLTVDWNTDLGDCYHYQIIDCRAVNCLKRNEIRTIGKLLELLSTIEGLATLRGFKNLGEKSVNQLRKLTKEPLIGKTFLKPSSQLGHGMFANASCLNAYRLNDWQEIYKIENIISMNIDLIIDHLQITTHLAGALQKFVRMCLKLHPQIGRSSIGLSTLASHTYEEVSKLTTPKYAQLLMHFIGEFGLKFHA